MELRCGCEVDVDEDLEGDELEIALNEFVREGITGDSEWIECKICHRRWTI